MTTMNIAEAKAKLSELVARAEAGEEVVIARNGKPRVRLVAADPDPRPKRRRRIGLWDHLGLDLSEDLFLTPDQELIEAAERSRIFPPDE
jgi:prevent-host-death family protein